MWSDPEEIETWQVGPRGAGWLFGSRVTFEVLNCYLQLLMRTAVLQDQQAGSCLSRSSTRARRLSCRYFAYFNMNRI